MLIISKALDFRAVLQDMKPNLLLIYYFCGLRLDMHPDFCEIESPTISCWQGWVREMEQPKSLHRGRQPHGNSKGTAFRLFLYIRVVHNDSPANPHESRLLGNRQTHFTILNTFEGGAGAMTSAFFMPLT